MYRVVLCPEVGVVTVVGESHRGDAGEPCGPPGEKWGGYVAASRSPSGGADGVAASAAIEQFMILTLVFERAAARGPSQ